MFEPKPGENPFTTAVFMVAAQVGCMTFLIIIVALISGLALDRWLDTLPLFTILFLVGSMPVSWFMVYRVVNRAKSNFTDKPAAGTAGRQKAWEDVNSDRDK